MDPVTALALLKVASDGVGWFFKPKGTVREAKAEAEASLIKTKQDIENADLQQRARHGREEREVRQQQNIDAIEGSAQLLLTDGANPDAVDEDWKANVYEKCRNVSDEEMRSLWARVIAAEVNTPGSFARRTVNAINDLDKIDCLYFTMLCRINVAIDGEFNPLIIDIGAEVYKKHQIIHALLAHLDSIGLIHYMGPGAQHTLTNVTRKVVSYFGDNYLLEMPPGTNLTLPIGRVRLTHVGSELARISGATPIPEFREYLLATWSHLLKPIPPLAGVDAKPAPAT